jgi:hypothetical protein
MSHVKKTIGGDLATYIAKKYGKFKLSHSQKEAILALDHFLNGEARCFVLQGYAGTGKTFLVQSLAEYAEKKDWDVALMAPTGRAAEVLMQRTGFEASTIHKAIYNSDLLSDIEHNEEGDSYRWYFESVVLSGKHNKTVLIVDESSMVSDSYSSSEFLHFGSGFLLRDLIKFSLVRTQSPSSITKLIFIGDPAQLPPVSQKKDDDGLPPALDLDYLCKKYRPLVPSMAELTDVVRHKGGIVDNATWIRSRLTTGTFGVFKIDCNKKDVWNLPGADLAKTFLKRFDIDKLSRVIVIVYSNKQAQLLNRSIREKRFKVSNPPIKVDDALLVNANNSLYGLTNGSFCRVLEVGDQTVKTLLVGRYDKKAKKRLPHVKEEFSFREITIQYALGDALQNKKVICLENVLTSDTPSISRLQRIALYQNVIDSNPTLPVGSADFEKALKSDPYFNSVQFKYGYAVTCHKSQGGEWDCAIVDFSEFTSYRYRFFFKWAYTAITRAAKRLYVMGAPVVTPFSGIKVSGPLASVIISTTPTIVPVASISPKAVKLISPKPKPIPAIKLLPVSKAIFDISKPKEHCEILLKCIKAEHKIDFKFDGQEKYALLYSFTRKAETARLKFHFDGDGVFSRVESKDAPPTALGIILVKIILGFAAEIKEEGPIPKTTTDPLQKL